jgi:hypothetical protein
LLPEIAGTLASVKVDGNEYPMSFRQFLACETGAVTTDWVVLTAGITGLGIAVATVVSDGVGDVSGDIATTLSDVEILSAFPEAFEAVQLAAMDFAGGLRGDWTGGALHDAGGEIGELLAVGGGTPSAELAISIPEGANQAVLTFDLIGGDSIDREPARIMINGTPVMVATGDFGSIAFDTPEVDNIRVETNVRTENVQLGGNMTDTWNESVTSVTITVDDPQSVVRLGIESDTNQSIGDEYYGIDNVVAEAR